MDPLKHFQSDRAVDWKLTLSGFEDALLIFNELRNPQVTPILPELLLTVLHPLACLIFEFNLQDSSVHKPLEAETSVKTFKHHIALLVEHNRKLRELNDQLIQNTLTQALPGA